MKHVFAIIMLILAALLARCSVPEFTALEGPAIPDDTEVSESPVIPDTLQPGGKSGKGTVPAAEDEIAGLLGYWRSGSSYYMEIGEEELIIRDSMKRPIMETGYEVVKYNEKLYLHPQEDFFTYPNLAEPYATVTELYCEDGTIYLHYYHHYMPDETKEAVFEATEEGPFDNILIRDDEYLEELQGRWQEDPSGFSVLTIDGNHMTVGYESDGEYIVLDEMDIHVISYRYAPERVYLIQDDLIETEFYGFTQFEYLNGRLCANEMVMDADWDTSVEFVKTEE